MESVIPNNKKFKSESQPQLDPMGSPGDEVTPAVSVLFEAEKLGFSAPHRHRLWHYPGDHKLPRQLKLSAALAVQHWFSKVTVTPPCPPGGQEPSTKKSHPRG